MKRPATKRTYTFLRTLISKLEHRIGSGRCSPPTFTTHTEVEGARANGHCNDPSGLSPCTRHSARTPACVGFERADGGELWRAAPRILRCSAALLLPQIAGGGGASARRANCFVFERKFAFLLRAFSIATDNKLGNHTFAEVWVGLHNVPLA